MEHPYSVGQKLDTEEVIVAWAYGPDENYDDFFFLTILAEPDKSVFGNYAVYRLLGGGLMEQQYFKNICPATEYYNEIAGVW
jgi:hypothetical protein